MWYHRTWDHLPRNPRTRASCCRNIPLKQYPQHSPEISLLLIKQGLAKWKLRAAVVTKFTEQPLIAFNQLIQHCWVVGRRLIGHYPACSHYFQPVLWQQSIDRHLHNHVSALTGYLYHIAGINEAISLSSRTRRCTKTGHWLDLVLQFLSVF